MFLQQSLFLLLINLTFNKNNEDNYSILKLIFIVFLFFPYIFNCCSHSKRLLKFEKILQGNEVDGYRIYILIFSEIL